MYSSFFGLNEKPFAITPDPRYLYLSRRHAEALAHLLYGITESGGFIQLTGEVGTGKTTLVRSLLEQLPEHAEVALVLNPRLSPQEFLLTICDELHVEVPHRESQMEVVNALNRKLLEAHSAGRRVVLIVDEAQNLSADVLEQIRLLTNLETAKQKLLQIILIGQPELREVLARSDLRQLAQRITGRYHLEPLEADELRAYVQHRLEVAGSRAEIFTPAAHKVLHRCSKGIPRLANVIADRALLGAWSQEEQRVTGAMARTAAGEVFGGTAGRKPARATGLTRLAIGLAGIGIAILAGVVTALVRDHQATAPAAAAHVSSARPDGPAPQAQGAVMPIQRARTLPPQLVAAEPEAESDPEASAVALLAPQVPLAQRLAEGELGTGTDAAFSALFSLWRLEYTPEAGPACEQAATRGLRCLLQRGSWGELGRLDRPAIIVLTDRDGRDHQVVLAGLAQDGARILAGESTVSIPLGELLTLWYGEFLMLWRPEAGDGRLLARNARGTDVLWLRRTLGELRGAPVAPSDSPLYDASLESAVREFQRASRLVDDGIAGAMTLISLQNTVGLGGRPRLQEAD